jgi:hypothetical protein
MPFPQLSFAAYWARFLAVKPQGNIGTSGFRFQLPAKRRGGAKADAAGYWSRIWWK